MFGEYLIYVKDKPLLLICDNTVFVKKHACLAELLIEAECGIPYHGAKEHYILDFENNELTEKVLTLLEKVTPLPQKKKKTN